MSAGYVGCGILTVAGSAGDGTSASFVFQLEHADDGPAASFGDIAFRRLQT